MAKLVNGIAERIKTYDGFVLSANTLNPDDLIPKFLSVLEPCDEIQEILYNPMGRDKNEILNDLWDVMERIDIGTDKYVFSTNEGDGACIGWFNVGTFSY